jgi:hypothetical protein
MSSNADQQFVVLERFIDKVACTRSQSFLPGIRIGYRVHQYNRNAPPACAPLNLSTDSKSIGPSRSEVQQDQIRQLQLYGCQGGCAAVDGLDYKVFLSEQASKQSHRLEIAIDYDNPAGAPRERRFNPHMSP